MSREITETELKLGRDMIEAAGALDTAQDDLSNAIERVFDTFKALAAHVGKEAETLRLRVAELEAVSAS